jgi:hypothetical protein
VPWASAAKALGRGLHCLEAPETEQFLDKYLLKMIEVLTSQE